MVVRIRLARHGTRNNPFYHLVAIRDKAARNARPIEKLGEYDPIPRPRESATEPVQGWTQDIGGSVTAATSSKEIFDKPITSSGIQEASSIKLEKRIEWNVERIKYWLSVGAQPSKPVAKMLDRAGLIPEGKWFKGMYRPPSEQPVWPPSARPKEPQSKILRRVAQSEESKQKELAETIDVTEKLARSVAGGDEEAAVAAKQA